MIHRIMADVPALQIMTRSAIIPLENMVLEIHVAENIKTAVIPVKIIPMIQYQLTMSVMVNVILVMVKDIR